MGVVMYGGHGEGDPHPALLCPYGTLIPTGAHSHRHTDTCRHKQLQRHTMTQTSKHTKVQTHLQISAGAGTQTHKDRHASAHALIPTNTCPHRFSDANAVHLCAQTHGHTLTRLHTSTQ